MSQKVYKSWKVRRMTEAYNQLPQAEKDKLFAELEKIQKAAGAKTMVACWSYWADEDCLGWGVDEFPDLESAFKHGEALRKLDWGRYLVSESVLGVPFEDQPA